MTPSTKKKVQPLSIQRLDLKKVKYRLKEYEYEISMESSLTKMIKTIMKIHNDKKLAEENKLEKRRRNKKMKDDYDEKYTQIQDENKGYRPGNERTIGKYSVKCYCFTKTLYTALAIQSQPIPECTKNSHYIVFFYKDGPSACIYALTSGDAWKVLRPYVDYSFPIKIVEEVGNPENIIEIVRRGLFGDYERQKSLRGSKYELFMTSHLHFFCESFRCAIMNDSKLFKLIDIKNKGKYVINVTTGGLLRILERISFEDFPPILDLFSEYMSVTRNGTSSRFEFLHFAKLAEIQHELDQSMIDHIYSRYKSKKELPTVHVRLEKLEEFLSSNSFKIKINNYQWDTKSKPPNIEEIVERIDDEASNEDEFRKMFLESELKFKIQASKRWGKWRKIIDCVETELRHSEKTYFKIRKLWYEIMPYHLTLLEDDFRKVIKNVLIEKKSEWWLHRPWTGNCEGKGMSEKLYNRQYQNDDRCLVLDEITPDKIECCDIVKYTDDEVYLYQVKEKFGQGTRTACSQIHSAANAIRSAILIRKSPTYLEKVWNEATTLPLKPKSKEAADWRRALKSRMESVGKDAFINIFRNRKITFVYAYLPTQTDNSNSFFNILNENTNEEIEDHLMEKLIEADWLDSDGRITGQFLSTPKKNFRITDETPETSNRIYNLLKKRVLSNSTSGKIELVRLMQILPSLNCELKVCEIEKIPLEPQPEDSQTRKAKQTKITKYSPSKSQNSQNPNPVSKVCKNKKISSVSQTPEKIKQTEITDFFASPMKKRNLEETFDE